MADINTDRLRKIQRVAADRIHPDCHTARERLTEQVPAIADEIDRLRVQVARLKAANGHLKQELARRPQR